MTLDWTLYTALAGVAALLLMPREHAHRARWMALATALAGLLCAVVGSARLPDQSGVVTLVRVPWVSALGLEFHLAADGISVTLVLLTALAATAGVAFSWNVTHRPREFFALYFGLIGATYGVFLSFDLFLLFVFYELAIVPKYFLIAIWGSTRREYGAMKLVIYSFVGSALVLLGMVAVFVLAGSRTMDLNLLARHVFPETFQVWAFPLIFIGFGVLAGLWPFHTWAPTGHVAAPTAASMLLAGVIMKLGAYGALRVAVALFPEGLRLWAPAMGLLAVVGIVSGALVALVQRDFKFVIGYSSVSHMGFVLLGLVSLSLTGLSGAVVQMFSHGVIAGLLFAVVGRMVYDRAHTRELDTLAAMRLGRALPFAGVTFALAAAASMGMPGFSGFVAELQVLVGTWKAFPGYVLVAGLGILLGAAYSLRALQLGFYAEERGGTLPADTAPAALEPITIPERLGAVLLLGATLTVGLYPRCLLNWIEPALASDYFEGLRRVLVAMNPVDYLGMLKLALPEAILAAAMLAVLAVDLLVMRGLDRSHRRMVAAALSAAGCLLAAFLTGSGRGAAAEGAVLMADPLSVMVQVALLGLAALTVGVSTARDVGEHVGEYYALVLLATIGMLFLVASEHLLMIFVSLELTSLALYVLAGLNKHDPRSVEAALKYFLYGSVASAFALFGFSLVYGSTGALELRQIAQAVQGHGLDPMPAAALVMIVAGFGFKVAVVPFHLWAPDTYQGAPNASAAFIASSSKLAGFVILAKIMLVGFPSLAGGGAWRDWTSGWVPLLATLATLSMVLGNLAALVQRSVKRLLAYSAIAHAGYTLVGVTADNLPGVVAIVYYAATYAVAALGAFAVAGTVETADGDARLESFAGLGRRSPLMAMCLLVFLLSLAGIPPLAGFYGKFALFASAVAPGPGYGLLWLVAVAVVASAVSLYYYLIVLKEVFVRPPAHGAPPLQPGPVLGSAVVVMALLVIVLGCLPDLLVGPLNAAVTAADW